MNVSRIGILLASKNPAYYRSMDVMVTFPYSNSPSAMQAEQPGRVVRISEMPDGRRSVAIALGVTHSPGRGIHLRQRRKAPRRSPGPRRKSPSSATPTPCGPWFWRWTPKPASANRSRAFWRAKATTSSP